jgi:hypothetical protein
VFKLGSEQQTTQAIAGGALQDVPASEYSSRCFRSFVASGVLVGGIFVGGILKPS